MESGYEIIYGQVRRRAAGVIRNFNSRLFYKVMNLLTEGVFPENVSDFRLMDRKVYEAINAMPEQNKYLRGLVMWTGYSSIGVPFDRVDRFAGVSKADFSTALKVATNGIFSFSYFPLRAVTFIGLFMTGISFLMILAYLYLYLIHGQVAPGVNTIIILMLFLFGVLFLSRIISNIWPHLRRSQTSSRLPRCQNQSKWPPSNYGLHPPWAPSYSQNSEGQEGRISIGLPNVSFGTIF